MDIIQSVTTKIAQRKGCAMTELPPLYNTVDPDALRAAIGSMDDRGSTIEFQYCGFDVIARGDESIEISRDAPAQPV